MLTLSALFLGAGVGWRTVGPRGSHSPEGSFRTAFPLAAPYWLSIVEVRINHAIGSPPPQHHASRPERQGYALICGHDASGFGRECASERAEPIRLS